MRKIIAGIASIPSREKTLHVVLKSLIRQVDIIELALNDYPHIPEYLSRPIFKNVIVNRCTNEMGDANKFLNVGKYKNAYYFSCDDDLIYPQDYVKTYIRYIDKRRCLITSHGSQLKGNKIKSYFRERYMVAHCLHKLDKAYVVQVPGSGVSGFYTGDIQLKYMDFETPNMADIYLAVALKKQKARAVAIPHRVGWLKDARPGASDTLYLEYRNKDHKQTEVINSVQWV